MNKAKKIKQADSFEQAIAESEDIAKAQQQPLPSAEKPAPEPVAPVVAFFARISSSSADTPKLIAEAKSNPEWAAHIDAQGFNALTLSLLFKRKELALELIKLNSDLNACSKEIGWNPLTIASGSFTGEDAVAHALLNAGANPNAKTHHGLYALTSCCTYGNTSLAVILIAKGAIAAPTDAGWLPIIAAAGSSDTKLVDLLVKNGADVNSALGPKNGFTALHQAVKSKSVEMVKHLIKLEASPLAMNIEGDTPLHFAAVRGLREVSKLLVASGALPQVENIAGKTASDFTSDPELLKTVAFKCDRTKHPLSGKSRKTATINEMPEPGVKKAKTETPKKALAKKTPVKKALKELTQAALRTIKDKAPAKATAKKPSAAPKTAETKKAAPKKKLSK